MSPFPTIPLPDKYSKEIHADAHIKSNTEVCTEALFVIAKEGKQPKHLSTGEWINKLWGLHTVGYHTAVKRNEPMVHVTPWMNHNT